MQQHTLIALAAPPTLAVVRDIRPEQLDAPTPCSDFDVRGLIAHMRQWGPALESAARTQPPAEMIGAMAIGEIVVHGWDLARATGQQVAWDLDLLEFLHDEVAKTAELGREMHAYGPEVAVPPSAPPLARMLGLTGRDPRWQADSQQG